MTGFEDVAFIHLCVAGYMSPADLVCLILTSRDLCETYGNSETYRAVAKSFFGSVEGGSRGHLSRRHRKKKGAWRAGDGAKARLSLLWQERTRNNVSRLQNAHLLQQREHERRWVMQQVAAVMRTCAYAPRHHEHGCFHAKLRLWTSAIIVAAKKSSRSQERIPSHHGVRCSRCATGPIAGTCYRCAAGCCGARSNTQLQGSIGVGGVGGGCGGGRDEEGYYTLCEACFSERRRFHPPHPFAPLRAGFAESRLSGPVLYEAVCGDCSFGSLVLVRPLKAREDLEDSAGTGDLWAVPVRVEAAGPLPLSQVKIRISAGDRDDNRGLAFASERWRLRKQQQQEQEEEEGGRGW